ncbi:hypothetical protein, partial [Porphyromonas somerae]|uniref:hypothetical protein n=1 Tax=Porphyromonas somerae TaxID=322095 RepID=UPI002A75B374
KGKDKKIHRCVLHFDFKNNYPDEISISLLNMPKNYPKIYSRGQTWANSVEKKAITIEDKKKKNILFTKEDIKEKRNLNYPLPEILR